MARAPIHSFVSTRQPNADWLHVLPMLKRFKTVTVSDRMQRNYRYELSALAASRKL